MRISSLSTFNAFKKALVSLISANTTTGELSKANIEPYKQCVTKMREILLAQLFTGRKAGASEKILHSKIVKWEMDWEWGRSYRFSSFFGAIKIGRV